MRVKVLSTGRFSDAQLERLRLVSSRLQIEQVPTNDWTELEGRLDEVEVLYTYRVPAGWSGAPNLRWIQLGSAGLNALTGHPLLENGDVRVTTASGIHAVPIAEYVMASMVAFSRGFPMLLERQRRAEWAGWQATQSHSRELRGATLGIVGYGSIGREVARLACAYGMRVLALKRDPAVRRDRGYAEPGVGDPEGRLPDQWYGPAQLHQLLTSCDYVVISVPLTPATRGMIDAQALRAMKPDAYLVNIARGPIIVERDLIQALKEGWIAGAGLDVFDEEPLPAGSALWRLDNVILTPHAAAATPPYDERASVLFAENLRRYLAGESLLNEVNPALGY